MAPTEHPITRSGAYPRLDQGPQHADLDRSQAASARQHEGHLSATRDAPDQRPQRPAHVVADLVEEGPLGYLH